MTDFKRELRRRNAQHIRLPRPLPGDNVISLAEYDARRRIDRWREDYRRNSHSLGAAELPLAAAKQDRRRRERLIILASLAAAALLLLAIILTGAA